MNPQNMMRIAKALADGRTRGRRGRPNQEELRRSLSTAYYALFHALAGSAADLFVGTSRAVRKSPAWVHTYRSLQHGFARQQCDRVSPARKDNAAQPMQTFDSRIIAFATAFVTMQQLREDADYNPEKTFYRSEVHTRIRQAEQALNGLGKAPKADRRAFAALLMHRTNRR